MFLNLEGMRSAAADDVDRDAQRARRVLPAAPGRVLGGRQLRQLPARRPAGRALLRHDPRARPSVRLHCHRATRRARSCGPSSARGCRGAAWRRTCSRRGPRRRRSPRRTARSEVDFGRRIHEAGSDACRGARVRGRRAGAAVSQPDGAGDRALAARAGHRPCGAARRGQALAGARAAVRRRQPAGRRRADRHRRRGQGRARTATRCSRRRAGRSRSCRCCRSRRTTRSRISRRSA